MATPPDDPNGAATKAEAKPAARKPRQQSEQALADAAEAPAVEAGGARLGVVWASAAEGEQLQRHESPA